MKPAVTVAVSREEIEYTKEVREALEAITKKSDFRLPFARAKLSLDLANVPTAVANSLRRVLAGEMKGRCLTFDASDFDREVSTDPFMNDYHFVRRRIQLVPLRPQIPETTVRSLRLSLYAVNDTDKVMMVYSGDLRITEGSLSAPIFNPTIQLAFLQPGKALKIDNIRIEEGFGDQSAAFVSMCRTTCHPLDVQEYRKKETHSKDGERLDESGYKTSGLVANPRRHRVTGYVPAAPADPSAVVALAVDACANIVKRLRFVLLVLEQGVGDSTLSGAHVTLSKEGDKTKCVLAIKNETHTIGNLVSRVLHELVPAISYVSYSYISHEKMLKIVVVHAVSEDQEIVGLLTKSAKAALSTFSEIQQQLRAATLK